jgi:sugar transferase (PEP-CTERM/EpsH1 system associated)
MVQYADLLPEVPMLLDFVDVDSAKWSEYAKSRPWPLAWIYRREALRLLAFERAVAGEAAATVFVTQPEADLFLRLAPETRGRVHAVQNGVDHEYFRPDPARPSPFAAGEEAIVFTGAMDYWPNVDAVSWFAREVMPRVSARRPLARFWIVGMNPAANVFALRGERVVVTGRVDDVRPYVQHAGVVVAPLRVARGVQNKVLEAMALGQRVVVSAACATPIGARDGVELDVADSPASFAERVLAALDDRAGRAVGEAARRFAVEHFDWGRNLAAFTELLEPSGGPAAQASALESRHATAQGHGVKVLG